MSFWDELKKPIIGLSQMDGVTDSVYRYIIAKYGGPDISFTEFIPVEGIIRLNEKLLTDFWYSSIERPIIAQIYGNSPELFYSSAQLVCELGFDGIDINMGCPAKSVARRGCGAALIRTPELARELIKTTKQAVYDWQRKGEIDWASWPVINGKTAKTRYKKFLDKSKSKSMYDDRTAAVLKQKIKPRPIPVSVKTRIGFESPCTEEWIPQILTQKPAAITVHGRTLKQMYTGQADWYEISKAVELRNKYSKSTIILGNGDIKTIDEARERISQSKVDGILVGRGTYGKPWLFKELIESLKRPTASATTKYNIELNDIFAIALDHCRKHEAIKGQSTFFQMRKNLSWYISNIHGASELRQKLMKTNSSEEVTNIFQSYLKHKL